MDFRVLINLASNETYQFTRQICCILYQFALSFTSLLYSLSICCILYMFAVFFTSLLYSLQVCCILYKFAVFFTSLLYPLQVRCIRYQQPSRADPHRRKSTMDRNHRGSRPTFRIPSRVPCGWELRTDGRKYRTHRCQPSRNRAGNPAFWLICRIPAFLRERPAFLALFRNNKNR